MQTAATAGNSPAFSAKGQKIGIFVIAYNAERHIEKTLDRIPDDVWNAIDVVYVVDDCSTDNTTGKAMACSDREGKLVVLRNRTNRRYGGNQKFGYHYAIEHGLDHVVMLHADGQYAPELLSDMLLPLLDGRADVVLGSRMVEKHDALKGGMPKYKYFGNILLTGIENRLSGMQLAEFHSGYRAYRVAFLRSIPFYENSNEWHFDTHILFQAKQANARVVEIPIPTYYGDEICHVNGMVYGMNCIISAMAFFLFRRNIFYSRKYDLTRKGSRYGEKFDDPASSHSLIWDFLQQQKLVGLKVLELGVGDASLTRRLHDAGAIIDGVELDESAAEAARQYCRVIHVGDLDRIDEIGLAGDYDLVLAADVLEHLVHPDYVLSRLKTLLKVNGILVVSLPNIANIYVRLNLLFGRYPTHSKGLLDEAHLHCYTLKTMRRLLAGTGWRINESHVTAIPLLIVFPFLRHRLWRAPVMLFHHVTRWFKGLLAYQGVFVCQNPNESELL